MAERDLGGQSAWDTALLEAGGHLLQSWSWGAFKRLHGWDVERVRIDHGSEFALAQVLFRSKGPVAVAYLPRGPALSSPDPFLARDLFGAIDDVCRRRRALSLIVEPDVPLPFRGRYAEHGFVRGPRHIQPARTVKVDLAEDNTLLMQMHQKTRYNIRLAQRRGVTAAAVEPTDLAVARFYALLRDTSQRNEFSVHDLDYYADFLREFGDDAALCFAHIDEVPVAGLIVARFGPEAIYMYGGSSTTHRAHGAAFFLQFEAMRWARDRGCRRYDLWDIPVEDPPKTQGAEGDRVAPTRGDDWRGLFEFKVRFGGSIVRYPPSLERRYRPVLATLARRFYDGTG